jgi:ATP-dependent helicase HrpB
MPIRTDLPISPLLPTLVGTLGSHTRLVLEAPPGAGKTTQVPLALLDAPWLAGQRVLMLEPRRIAARAAASYMAEQLGEAPGQTVGWRIRGDSRVSAATRIEVVTEAILTRMLQDDPALDGVGAVLFDEFHERNLHADLGLALALDAQANLRDDLRIVVMSATLDGERLAGFLDAPRLTAEGRAYPVDVHYLPPGPHDDALSIQRRAVERALAATDGDVLVFLPGKREIEKLSRALDDVAATRGIAVLPLHGELDLTDQRAVLAPPPPGTRRVVLATNVAESSVTLPAVRAVVDAGLAREPRYDPVSGFSRLATVAIAQPSAVQRAGRAGRVAPGQCWRLWPESQRLDRSLRAEILQVELSTLALELAAWGSSDLRFVDPPPPGPLAEARERLTAIGALDAAGRITAHGRAVLRLGTHPRFAHMILAAPAPLRALACDLAALIEARDPLRGPARLQDDLDTRVTALARWRADRRVGADVDRGAIVQIDQQAAELRRRAGAAPARGVHDPYDTGALLALAYPDRVARQDPADPRRYTLANGRGARLRDNSQLVGAPWLVVSDLHVDPRETWIGRAAAVDEAHLRDTDAARFVRRTERSFNSDTRAVEAVAVDSYAGITLGRQRLPTPRDAETTAMLLAGIRALGIDALPWSEGLTVWRARARCLRDWLPDEGLPDCGDTALLASLEEWLAPWLEGKTRLSELDAGTLAEALRAPWSHAQRRLVDAEAPAALAVPSGRELRLEYSVGAPPVLAVKLQELFGLADTPRIARGRVPVTLHLLSPAQRPIQVTQDLKSFWARTYPEVKKELKGRYPRHPWPDDPWNATATHRAKPRGT